MTYILLISLLLCCGTYYCWHRFMLWSEGRAWRRSRFFHDPASPWSDSVLEQHDLQRD